MQSDQLLNSEEACTLAKKVRFLLSRTWRRVGITKKVGGLLFYYPIDLDAIGFSFDQ